MIINNPHVFYYEIKDSQTEAVTYTIPYCIENGPSVDNVDDIVSHLVEAIKTKRQSLGWNHSDLLYHIRHYSPEQSGMDIYWVLNLDYKVGKILDEME